MKFNTIRVKYHILGFKAKICVTNRNPENKVTCENRSIKYTHSNISVCNSTKCDSPDSSCDNIERKIIP